MAEINPSGPGISGQYLPVRSQTVRPGSLVPTSRTRRPTRSVGGRRRSSSDSALGGGIHDGRSEDIFDETPIDTSFLLWARKNSRPGEDWYTLSESQQQYQKFLKANNMLTVWVKNMAANFTWAAQTAKNYVYKAVLGHGIVSVNSWGGYEAG